MEKEEQEEGSKCTPSCLHPNDGHYADAFGPVEERF